MVNKPSYKKVLFVSDIHAPFHDQKAIDAMMSFAKWWKPQTIVFIGDLLDCYSLSRFVKDPQRALQLQKEIDIANKVIANICGELPSTRRIFLKGNHEQRIQSYLWTKASELSGLNGLQLENLLDFDKWNIEYFPTGRFKLNNVVIKHGDIVRKFPVYSAKAEFDATGLSGVSGHTHRIGMFSETNEAGEYLWMEIGCLCKMKQEYMSGKMPNWQQGFGIGYFRENSHLFNLDTVRIIKGAALYGGMEFS